MAIDFVSAWRLFDTDDEGVVNKEQFKIILRALELCPSEKDMDAALKGITESDDTIRFDKGKRLFEEKQIVWKADAEELKRALSLFESNGKVPVSEIKSVMCTMGEKMRESDVDALLQRVNVENGMILIDDFIQLLMGRK